MSYYFWDVPCINPGHIPKDLFFGFRIQALITFRALELITGFRFHGYKFRRFGLTVILTASSVLNLAIPKTNNTTSRSVIRPTSGALASSVAGDQRRYAGTFLQTPQTSAEIRSVIRLVLVQDTTPVEKHLEAHVATHPFQDPRTIIFIFGFRGRGCRNPALIGRPACASLKVLFVPQL